MGRSHGEEMTYTPKAPGYALRGLWYAIAAQAFSATIVNSPGRS